MLNNSRTIENVLNMLKYLYSELNSKRFESLDITNISNIDNLYALVISHWASVIAKEGLYKEYVEVVNEELTSPKGQINIQQSIVMQTKSRGTLICSYDELSDNVYVNHILKGMLNGLLVDREICESIKIKIRKTMQMFNGVDSVDITKVHWKDIKYNNNNIRYKHLIELIHNTINERKLVKQGVLNDDTRVYLLFKKQLVLWMRQEYGVENDVSLFEQPFDLDIEPQFEVKLNKTQKLVVISTSERALLFCIRLQDELVLGDATVGKRHMFNLAKCLREYTKKYKVKTIGCMLYVNVDRTKLNLQPMVINTVSDFVVGEQVVDIHDYWKFIANKVNEVYKAFILRGKKHDSVSK